MDDSLRRRKTSLDVPHPNSPAERHFDWSSLGVPHPNSPAGRNFDYMSSLGIPHPHSHAATDFDYRPSLGRAHQNSPNVRAGHDKAYAASQMNRAIHLNVLLPRDRDHPGWIRVEVNGAPQAEFRVLGRGSTTVKGHPTDNPTRSPFKYAGDTPTGDYVSPELVSTEGWDRDSYGPSGAVRLKAIAGDALLAESLGREGLLIHGGAEGRFEGYRSTLGCLRLHNADMKALIGIISGAGDNATAQMCESVSISVSVREF